MKRAYLILAHNDPNHLKKMIMSLGEKNDYYVHLDNKSDISDFSSLLKENVFFIKQRINISWGGFSMVEAMLELIKAALNSEIISGNDYPIKNEKIIDEFFERYSKNEIIRAYYITGNLCPHCAEKIERKWFFDNKFKNPKLKKIYRSIKNSFVQFRKKSLYVNINSVPCKVAYGSQWFALTNECAEYVISTVNNNPNLINYFKHSLAPDEMFFHTIIFNSRFSENTIMNGIEEYSPEWHLNNYTYIDTTELNCKVTNKMTMKRLFVGFYKNIVIKKDNQGTVSFLTKKDFIHLKNCQYIFARKFNTRDSSDLIRMIEETK